MNDPDRDQHDDPSSTRGSPKAGGHRYLPELPSLPHLPQLPTIDQAKAQVGRSWRKWKWAVRLLVGIPIVLTVLTLALMRSPVVGMVLRSQVHSRMGCTLAMSRAFIELDGTLVVEGPILRIDGVAGEAGEVLRAESAKFDMEWSGLVVGSVTCQSMQLERPLIRVSQSSVDGTLNLSRMASAMPASSGGSGATGALPPAIDARDGMIEFSEHDDAGAVTILKSISVDGSFTPTRTDKPVYAMRLYERVNSDRGPSRGMVMFGSIDLGAGTSRMKLLYLPLSAWGAESIPSAYRDVWRSLDIQGEVKEVVLSSSPGEAFALEMELSGVGMTAPVPSDSIASVPGASGTAEALSLRDVQGTIALRSKGLTANLTGQIEGQSGRSRVRLQTEGLGLDAALRCEIAGRRVNVSKNPGFLPYVPQTVREYFEYFSGPTADIDGVAVLTRAAPVDGVPSPFKVSGSLAFRSGTAAFHKFPYPFHDMTGRVNFDEKSITILDIRGLGATGAKLGARGTISPLTDDAGVDLTLTISDVPVDQYLLDAMPRDRRELVKTIFNREAYERLLAQGLVREPNKDGVDGTRSAPPFAFAGNAGIEVRVRRKEGPGEGGAGEWLTDVDVRFEQAGVVPAPFPLPVVARDLHLHVSDYDARLMSGEFLALGGGKAEVSAFVSFFEEGKKVVKPAIQVLAEAIPINELLLSALPDRRVGEVAGTGEPAPKGLGGTSPQQFVRGLGSAGTIDCEVNITAADREPTPGEDPDVAYELIVGLDRVTARPRWKGEQITLGLERLSGSVRVTRHVIELENVRGELVTPGLASDPRKPVGSFLVDAVIGIDPKSLQEQAIDVRVGCVGLDVSQPIEELVGVVSDSAGTTLSEQRAARDPRGMVDATVLVKRDTKLSLGNRLGVEAILDRAQDLSVTGLGGRVGLELVSGGLGVAVPGEGDGRVHAENASVRLRLNDQDAGLARINGSLGFDTTTGVPKAPASFDADLSAWRFESPLLPPLVERLGDQSVGKEYRELDFAGEFRAMIRLSDAPGLGAGGLEQPSRRLLLTGFVEPSSIAFTRGGNRVAFESMTGRVSFESDPDDSSTTRGTIDGVVLTTPVWKAWADGDWKVVTQGGARRLRIDSMLHLNAQRVDDALRALMPGAIARGLEGVKATIDGPARLQGGRVALWIGGDSGTGVGGEADQTSTESSFVGNLHAERVGLDFGVGVSLPMLDLVINWPASDDTDAGLAHIRAIAPRGHVAGVELANLGVEVVRGDHPGMFDIKAIDAACHGGRLSGQATISVGGAAEDPAAYRVDLLMAGVRFAPLLAELTRAGVAADVVGPQPDASIDEDVSRGSLDARLSVAGVAGDVGSRVGRGAIRVAHGQVIRLPVIFPLMQVSNLILPSDDRFDRLESSFHLTGPTAKFDQIVVRSDSISMIGEGTLDLPTLALDMQFNSKGNVRIPIWSALFEALRDELVTTRITGTISDPIIGSETLWGTRRLLGGTGGPGVTVMDSAQQRAAELADRDRLRRPGGEVPTVSPRSVLVPAE